MNYNLSKLLRLATGFFLLSSLMSGCGNNSAPGANTMAAATSTLDKLALLDQPGATVRVSVAQDQSEADNASINSSISANGEIIVFDSVANNLDGQSSAGHYQIFAKDRRDDSVHRVSVSINAAIANGDSTQPDISDDGVFVAFVSQASNLVNNDNNNVADIFVRDLLRQVTTRISVASDGSEANAASAAPSISADGRYVVFHSRAALSPEDTNDFDDIYLHDRVSGETRLLSANAGQAGNGNSVQAKISANGQFVVFSSNATNLVANLDLNGVSDVFRVDSNSGQIDLISVNSRGSAANGESDSPSLNGDGSLVAFRSLAGDLQSPAATMALYQIFTRNLNDNSVALLSVSNAGEAANDNVFKGTAMSDDGRFVAYYTLASNLHINDNNGVWDVYVRDRENNNTQLVSVNSAGEAGTGSSFVPAINSDGHFISFGSSAANLVAGDTNDKWDVFLHVMQPHNFPPVALAGNDQSVYVGSTVSLNGDQSYDPDANINGAGPVVSYRWTLLDKPVTSALALGNITSAGFDFVVDVAGDYVFELIVNDGVQDSVADIVTVSARNNLPPQAHIQIDNSSGDAPLTVNVSAAQSSDPDGDSMTYLWDFGDPNADAANPNSSEQIQASHVYTQSGDYTIVLTVSDSAGNSAQTAVSVSASQANHAPVISPAADVQSGTAPLSVQFFANASDADNDSLSFSWNFADGSPAVTSENPLHLFQNSGDYVVTLSVSDGKTTVSANLLISVNSDLDFEVHRAYLELNKAHPASDKLALDLHVHEALPLNPDDLVVIKMDGVEVLSMTVAELKLASSAYWQTMASSDNTITHQFLQCAQHAGFSWIQFWSSEHELKIRLKMHSVDFKRQLTLNNGVDVQLQIGNRRGLRNIFLLPLPTHCQSLRQREGFNHRCEHPIEDDFYLRYSYGLGFSDKSWIP